MNQYPKKKFLETALFAAESASKLIQKTSNRSVKTYKSKTDLVTGLNLTGFFIEKWLNYSIENKKTLAIRKRLIHYLSL